MIKTADGKAIIFDCDPQSKTYGQQIERWPVDARILIDNGTHSYDPPEGVEAVAPKLPPRRVGVPAAPVVKVFEAPEPKKKKGDTDDG